MDRKLLCVPVYDTADVASSEQLAARDYWAEVGDGGRRRRLPGAYAKVGAELQRPAARPPAGRAHREVIAGWLGPRPGAGMPEPDPGGYGVTARRRSPASRSST